MKILLQTKLFFIFFMSCSFDTYAWIHQQTEENLIQKTNQEENQEFEQIKKRITIKIKDIICNSKELVPSQAHTLKLKESEIYRNIPIILTDIRKKFGISAVIAYEYSVDQFKQSFETSTPDGHGGIQPKMINHVIQAFSKGAGLEANLEFILNDEINTKANPTFLERQLITLFPFFEDKHSDGVKKIIKEKIQQEKDLSEYDISRILRDSFSSVFLTSAFPFKSFELYSSEWCKGLFSKSIDKNIQKRKENQNFSPINEASRDRSEVLAMVDRYKIELHFMDHASTYKHCLFSTIKDSLFDLQRIYGDSSLAVFNFIEQYKIQMNKIVSMGALYYNLEDHFEFCLDQTKRMVHKRIADNQHAPYNFGWDLLCLFVNNFEDGAQDQKECSENEAYLGSLMRNVHQLKEVGFSEEQLTKLLKHLLRNETQETGRIKVFEGIYEKFSEIKIKQNLENKKNSLDILRKAFVAFPELYQEKNVTIMNALLGILPEADKEDLSDQKRELYEQKLFGIFRVADWKRYAKRDCCSSGFVINVREILESHTQAQRKKETPKEYDELIEKISALFPEKDTSFLGLVKTVMDEHAISEEDAFGMIQMTHNSLQEQKEVEAKIISAFLHKEQQQ
ncbi:hypothetical protein [Holospora obtusa]|nr:hypothetical protein [Holospora obtusa]